MELSPLLLGTSFMATSLPHDTSAAPTNTWPVNSGPDGRKNTSCGEETNGETRLRTSPRGDIIILKDIDLFLRSWPMGHIIEVYPGSNGLERSVDVLVKGKIFRRPITKLVRLLRKENLPSSSPRGEYV